MAGEDIYSWSKTASNNGNADSLINWVEGQPRASVNNSARSQMAAHAKDRDLKNGTIVTTGTSAAQAFSSGVGYSAIPTGLTVKLKVGPGLTNTGAVTLAMDGLGAVAVINSAGAGLRGGEFTAGDYVALIYNGTNWVYEYSRQYFESLMTSGGGLVMSQQVFSTAGTFTYTPTPGMSCAIVETIGAGGGGGSATQLASTRDNLTGSGGGSGGYSRKFLQASEIGPSQTITVGAPGVGGVSGGAGAAGGDSSFGALCIAKGGSGGRPQGYNGGDGGVAGTGDIAVPGAPGEAGFLSMPLEDGLSPQSWSGAGGSSIFGGGAASPTPTYISGVFPGIAGKAGGGGSGGTVYQYSGIAGTGGAGGAGLVIVTEFGGRGAPGASGAPGPQGPAGPSGPGTGDVLRSGTPTANQIAQWTDASHIKGVDISALGLVGFSTGDAKITIKTVADSGWVIMNDGTIGSASSGASTRANADCQALFLLLFANITDAWAPITTSTGVATTRAAQGSAASAWAANCRMSLTKVLGRSLAIAGTGAGLTNHVLGQTDGEETHLMTIPEMPTHNHAVSPSTLPVALVDTSNPFRLVAAGGDYQVLQWGGQIAVGNISYITETVQGGNVSHNVCDPRSFWNIMIKL